MLQPDGRGSPDFFPWIDFPFTFSRVLGGERTFSLSTENGFVPAVGASGFPAVDVRLVPRLVSGVEVGFEIFTFCFLSANEGVIQPFDFFPMISR